MIVKRFFWLVLCLLSLATVPIKVLAQDRGFTLSAPDEITQTGFLDYLLPRFALKHGVRVTQVDGGGDAVIGDAGVAVFQAGDRVWHLADTGAEGPALFASWLLSDIGKRTIEGFRIDGTPVFTAVTEQAVQTTRSYDGDPVAGEDLSLVHCGRCHVVNHANRMKGMGQTPSFAVMRSFSDWQDRFASFYVLNPHPSFTQVKGITQPFSAGLPPAIVPVEMTQGDLESIIAYVATVKPADLGAALQNQ